MAHTKWYMSTEGIMALLYVFQFILKINPNWDNNGNLDLLYFAAIYILLRSKDIKKKYVIKNSFLLLLPFFAIELVNYVHNGSIFDMARSVIFMTKMFLCFVCMLYVVKILSNINLQKFINYTTALYLVCTFVAMFIRGPLLWRPLEGRMELFYLEPGELSVYVSLVFVLQMYICIETRYTKRTICNMAVLLVVLIFARGMSGITAGSIALAIIFVFAKKNSRTASVTNLAISLVVTCAVILLSTENVVSNRVTAVMEGTDYSFETRKTGNQEIVTYYLSNNDWYGYGFGSQRSEEGFKTLGEMNITAAYPMFAFEGGFAAIAFIIIYNLYVLCYVIKRRNALGLAFLTFNFLYLLYGSFMTNPISWILYGMAMSFNGINKIGIYKYEQRSKCDRACIQR